MIVVDASVAIRALLDASQRGDEARAAMSTDLDWRAPAGVFTFEVLHRLRSTAVKSGNQPDVRAAELAADDFLTWVYRTVDGPQLVKRVWALRNNVDPSDAFYVAAAEQLECPLLTADERLTNATGPRCEFRLV